MRYGYNTNGFNHHRLDDTLAILGDLGYQSVAITLDHHSLNPYDSGLPKQLETVRKWLEKSRCGAIIETGARFLLDPWRKHQPTLLSEPGSEQEKRFDFLRHAVDIA